MWYCTRAADALNLRHSVSLFKALRGPAIRGGGRWMSVFLSFDLSEGLIYSTCLGIELRK